jgi:PAS domain-containing protein
MEDDAQSVWLYLSCGLVRIGQSELDAWASHPQQTIQVAVFDSSDGVSNHRFTGGYSPLVAKSADGKLWFVQSGGVSVIDPRRLPFNNLPPPVHIEKVSADDKDYEISNGMQLPAGVRNLAIDYTALSFVVPEKVHFRYKLEGQNRNWREVVNDREIQYTNLAPGTYRFRVLACNSSGVWNEQGASLEFVILPMWYQTNWFRALCAAIFLALVWAAYQFRVRHLQRESKKLQDVIDTIPGNVWSALPDGSVDFINRRWLEFSGVSSGKELGRGWEAAVHPRRRWQVRGRVARGRGVWEGDGK